MSQLPVLPSNVKVRFSRKTKKLELVFLPLKAEPEVPTVEAPVVQSIVYKQAALEMDAAVAVLEPIFTQPAVKTVRRPVPVSAPAAVFPIVAKIYSKPVIAASSVLPQAPKIDYSQKGNLNGNRAFSLFK